MSKNHTVDHTVFVTNEKNCVECKTSQLTCPSCDEGFVCHLTIRTCKMCPAMTCVADNSHKQKSNNMVPVAVGISAATVAFVVMILALLARRKYRRTYSTRIASMDPVSTHFSSYMMEKHGSVDSKGSKFTKLSQIRSPKHRKPSASFSELNFVCHGTVLENDLDEEENIVTRPAQAVSPTHFLRGSYNRPPENLNGLMSPNVTRPRPPSQNWSRLSFPAMGEGLDMSLIDAQATRERIDSQALSPGLDQAEIDYHLSIQFPRRNP